jgi:hypothetical protein
LYGDVFGSTLSDIRVRKRQRFFLFLNFLLKYGLKQMKKPLEEEPVDPSLWGEMEDEVYEVMPDEMEDDEEEEEDEGEEAHKKEEENEEDGEEEVDAEDAAAGLKTPGEG